MLRKKKISRRRKPTLVQATVEREVKLTLEMLGFHIPSLIEEILIKVSGQKKCPCCGREVKPLITGEKYNAKDM
jgi:hypothetical protein